MTQFVENMELCSFALHVALATNTAHETKGSRVCATVVEELVALRLDIFAIGVVEAPCRAALSLIGSCIVAEGVVRCIIHA